MSELCLASDQLAHDVRALAGESELIRSAVVSSDATGDLSQLAGVRFWVPSFLAYTPELIDRFLQAMPRLEVIQTQSAGVDVFVGRVPVELTLCDARGVHGSSTSEWALTAILSVLREFPRFERAQYERRWDHRTPTEELAGKRVLVIGAGDVGAALGRRLQACDAEVVYAARTARDGVHSMGEIAELLPAADIVVLIVPKTSETVGMVDAKFLARLRDGALLVNAARGPVVDTDALVAELRTGRIRAALDVTDPEPLPPEHPLWELPNLLLTPHVGGAVRGLPARVAKLVSEQVLRFERGEPLINVVSGEY